MDDFQQDLIALVAQKHRVLLSEDDPVLVTATINEFFMARYQKNIEASLDQRNKFIQQLLLQLSSESSAQAEKIINASLAASTDYINQSSSELIETIEQFKRDISGQNEKTTRQFKLDVKIIFVSALVCMASLTALAGYIVLTTIPN